MKQAVLLICVLAMTACTTPDVSTRLAQARTEFSAFSSGVEVIVAHLEPYDTDLISAQERLTIARQNLLDAEGQGNPVAYAEAVEGAHAAFQQAEANSPIINPLRFRQTHARLLARTQPGADASEFVKYLEELRALFDSVNEEA